MGPVERPRRPAGRGSRRETIRDVGRQLDAQPVSGAPEPRDMLVELGRAAPRARTSRPASPSWKPRSNTDRCVPLGGAVLAINPDVPWLHHSMIGSRLRRGVRPSDGFERAARLGDGLCPLRGGLAAPRDAAAEWAETVAKARRSSPRLKLLEASKSPPERELAVIERCSRHVWVDGPGRAQLLLVLVDVLNIPYYRHPQGGPRAADGGLEALIGGDRVVGRDAAVAPARDAE